MVCYASLTRIFEIANLMSSGASTVKGSITSGSLRRAALPVDHIVAEMTAFPLASETAFRLGLTELAPTMTDTTPQFWRAAESALISMAPGLSLDELIAIRDRIWFGNSGEGTQASLHAYLRRVAEKNLEPAGAIANPKVSESGQRGLPPSACRSRQSWRWLSFALPSDLLLVGSWKSSQRPTAVSLVPPHLRTMLRDRGFAESHLHGGAALTFSLLWIAMLHRISIPGVRPTAFASPGAIFNEGRELAGWLLRAAITRYLLASFLKYRQTTEVRETFTGYMQNAARGRIRSVLSLSMRSTLDLAVRELSFGQHSDIGPSFFDLQSAYAALTGVRAQKFPSDLDTVADSDPIASLFRSANNKEMTPEMLFVEAGLNYLSLEDSNRGARKDSVFAKLFWQVVRIRCLFYRHITQRPMTPGLQWFVRTFGRISPGRRSLADRTLAQSAARVSGIDVGLQSLELRASPGTSVSEMVQYLRDIDAGVTSVQPHQESPCKARCELGIVFHLTKLRGGGFEEGLPKPNWTNTNADPGYKGNGKGYRFALFFQQRQAQAECLGRALCTRPDLIKLVRGFDVCTDEMGVPAWVMAPLFRYLRDTGNLVAKHASQASSEPIPPPRLTVHSGEDFVHLIGGLRNVDESICYYNLEEGDRIGHGVALGVDASRWAQDIGRIPVSIEQRLFDLTWEWCCYTRRSLAFSSNRLARIEDEISQLATCFFGEELRAGPNEVCELVEDLHCEKRLRRMGFPNGDPPSLEDMLPRERRLYMFLTARSAFQRGQQTRWVRPADEAEALEILQTHVRSRVASLGLTVEVNPTSNLLIGNMGDLQNHPMWRLRSPLNEVRPRLRISVGSDDPVVFATKLPQEFALMHDALILGGLSSDEASHWLDDAREAGMISRFTLPRPVSQGAVEMLQPPLRDEIPEILYG